MNPIKRNLLIVPIAAFLMCIAISACGMARVQVQSAKPAAKIDLAKAGVKTIAISDVEGPEHSRDLSDRLSAQLSTKGFQVLDRTAMAALVKEQALGQSGMVDTGTAAESGKITGAKVIVSIKVNSYQMTCTDRKRQEGTYPDGRKGVMYADTYTTVVDAAFKILDVKTAKVVAADHCRATRSRVLNADNQPPAAPDSEAALAECKDEVIEQFIHGISPYAVTEDVMFPEGDSMPSIAAGVRAAKIGEWNDAITSFREAVATVNGDSKPDDATKAKAHYCLGVALQMAGSFPEAEKELKMACALHEDPVYQAAFKQCQSAKADAKALGQ